MTRLQQFACATGGMTLLIGLVGGTVYVQSGDSFFDAPHALYLAGCALCAAMAVGLAALVDRQNRRSFLVVPALAGAMVFGLVLGFSLLSPKNLVTPASLIPMAAFSVVLGGLGSLIGLGARAGFDRLAARRAARPGPARSR